MSERKRGPQSDNDNVYVVADDDRLLCFDAIDREKTLKQRKKGNDEPVFSRYALNFEQNLISNFLFLKELEWYIKTVLKFFLTCCIILP